MTNVTILRTGGTLSFLHLDRPATMDDVERAIDKAIVLVCCLACLVVVPGEPALVVALLCAVTATGLAECSSRPLALAPSAIYAIAAVALPIFSLFLPLVAYDLLSSRNLIVRWCWLLPACAGLARLSFPPAVMMGLSCVLACLLSFRTERSTVAQKAYRHLCDAAREASLALEQKNLGLREKQDLEVRLATLAERGRIARDIHDNVGHLLTRSIMQVEALQVVHRGDDPVQREFAEVGATLHEAMDTVRASVHDLHEDAFDLRTAIEEAASSCAGLGVDIDYRADDVPSEVGYTFIAIVREALSNTVKHAHATQASVSVTAHPAFYRLIVHDNGSTRPSPQVLEQRLRADRAMEPGQGIGLATMSDRARALGGLLRIDYDRGFKVFVTVPKEERS